jgi:ribonuclease HI
MFSPVIKLPLPLTNEVESIYTLYFDGCCKGNPGPGGAGAVLYKNDEEIWSESLFVGDKVTNNIAEYTGLLTGLQYVVNQGQIKTLFVKGDSLLVIKQMRGEFKVNSTNLIELFARAKSLSSSSFFDKIEFEHVYRDKNKRADELSNQGLLKKNVRPK